ncbi:protein kinase domain-containing protein [Priestia megaterium]|uniref:protein kinase domain-containing protein n=1 Tax=Priestia megaterium TaxID=1404 RepID=UPI00300B4C6A
MTQRRYNIILAKDQMLGDRYILKEFIGEGTYGYVWKALRCTDEKIVALKIPKNQERGDLTLKEGSKLIKTSHPNLVQIYWMGRVDGYFVIEMEYFSGIPLSKELTESGVSVPRTFQVVYEIFKQILAGIAFMHRLKLAHGDIKPDNILISDRQVKLTDFGTSKFIEDIFVKTADGAGTYAYVAPEVIGSQKRYLNSDIYSLGVLLYQFLTGRTPHTTSIQVLHNLPFARPKELNNSITDEMENVISRALERDPSKRYQTIRDFCEAFSQAVECETTKVVMIEKEVPFVSVTKTRDTLEIAQTHCRVGKYNLAESILIQELAHENGLPDFQLQLAFVYFKTNRLYDAFNVVNNIEPDQVEDFRKESFKDSLYYLKGQILFELKQYEEALKVYRTLYQINPENLDYQYRLAMCCGLCGFEDEAIQLLEEINTDTPGVLSVVKKLGQAYDQKRDFNKARAYFRYALKLNPRDKVVIKKLEAYEFYL